MQPMGVIGHKQSQIADLAELGQQQDFIGLTPPVLGLLLLQRCWQTQPWMHPPPGLGRSWVLGTRSDNKLVPAGRGRAPLRMSHWCRSRTLLQLALRIC